MTKDESNLLFGRYVGVLGWGVPDEEEPGKHPDKTATTWKGIFGIKENSNANDYTSTNNRQHTRLQTPGLQGMYTNNLRCVKMHDILNTSTKKQIRTNKKSKTQNRPWHKKASHL